MTFPLSDMVSISLTIAAGGLRAANLSTPGLIAYHTAWLDYSRTFYSVSSAVAAGIVAGTAPHRMLVAAFSQNPSPTHVKLLRRATAPVHAVELTITTFAVGNTITATIHAPDGTSRSYSQAAGGVSIDAETTALTALINNDVSGYATAGSTELIAVAILGAGARVEIDPGAGAAVGQLFWYGTLANIDFEDVTPDPGLAADIALIQAEDDDWYGACVDSQSLAEQTVLAADLSADLKWVCGGTMDADVANDVVGNLGEVWNAASREKASLQWVPGDLQAYPGVAACAKMLAFKPGATTLANQNLAGCTAAINGQTLTEAQLVSLRSNRVNGYIEFGGLNIIDSQAGFCSYARYVDERLTLDYLEANIPVELANAIVALTTSGRKVPYTDAAAAIARAAIYKVCQLAESWGALLLQDGDTTYFSFSATPASAQLAADKTARIFRGCEFSCVITGAAQSFPLSGTLTFV